MMYPYAQFLLDFDRKHGSFVHKNSPANTRAAIILESRPFFFLPSVVRNTMFFLGEKWNLYILCGEPNERFVSSFVEGWDVNVIQLHGLVHLASQQYSQIMTSKDYWELFSEEKLVIFQTDSILCGPHIEEFIDYDFVGAPCGRFDEGYIANGGFSLRSRSKTLACLDRVPYRGEPEDVYFTAAMRQIGARVPDFATTCRFAVESIYTEHPVGVHGTDKCFHLLDVAEKIVRGIQY
jgi:hypothetical protein